MVGSCFSLLSGAAFGLYSNRGWMINPILMISVNLISMLLLASVLDVTSLIGALYFNIWVNIISFVMNFIYGFIKILKLKSN